MLVMAELYSQVGGDAPLPEMAVSASGGATKPVWRKAVTGLGARASRLYSNLIIRSLA
jgi:hypothetical protein